MLQVFHMDVAKVDRDVAYVAMLVHVYGMLQTFVSNISSVFSYACCKCVYLDVAYILQICCNVLSGCCVCFAIVFKCFYKCFRRMFQVFRLLSDVCFKCCIWMF
jgi:hypothetical protein